MSRPARSALAFLAGVVAGYGLSILGYIVATSVGGVFDRDGGLAMSVAFMIGPLVAIVCGIGAALWVARRA
jgi:hypothetical protein